MLVNNFATGFSVNQYMISQAAANDIPIAHPITPPKFAKIRNNTSEIHKHLRLY